MKVLLCIDFSTNWFKVFGNKCKLSSGEEIKIEQSEWRYISAKTVKGKCYVHLSASENPFPWTNQGEDRDVVPDFLLIRNFPSDLHSNNFLNQLIAFECGNLPSVNSISSIISDMQRPIQNAQLKKIQHKIEKEEGVGKISVVDMNYYNNQGTVLTIEGGEPIQFPCVIKVSNTNAGFGKAIAHNKSELDDIVSIIAVTKEYYTIEPFLDVDHEIRVQRIGDHTRAFIRTSDNCWKNNWGDLQFKDIPVEDRYVKWSDECSKMWGGIDIFAFDVLVLKDGSEVIIEINNTANGLMWQHEEEDSIRIKDLVINKMNPTFCPN